MAPKSKLSQEIIDLSQDVLAPNSLLPKESSGPIRVRNIFVFLLFWEMSLEALFMLIFSQASIQKLNMVVI